MKHLHLLILLIAFVSCNEKQSDRFVLEVKVTGDYHGGLFLKYGEKRDSTFLKDGKHRFTGKVDFPIAAYLATDSISSIDKNFYLENKKVDVDITIEKKQIREFRINMIKVVNVTGTETSEISKDFEAYRQKHRPDSDWNSKLYTKLDKIIRANPKHRYSGDLLAEISYDSVLSKKQIGDLYNELDLKFQDPVDIKTIEHNAFPEKEIKVGDSIYDFTLPNRLTKLISTNDYRNKMLFIDFWASWCKPCRAQFPELLKLNNDFKGKGLVILGVSLDNDLQKWLKAIDKDQPDWENVIDIQALSGEIAKKYGVSAVPKNFLVDEKGKIIAQDISLEELRTSMATHHQQEYKR